EVRAGSVDGVSKEGGSPTPSTVLARGRRGGVIDPSFAATPKPPEACARTLGEGRDRGGVPLSPQQHTRATAGMGGASPFARNMANFAGLKPPEACARTFGEGCGRGGASLTPVACYLHSGRGAASPFGQKGLMTW
ncbi:uncharacterized protein SCHCODRAFT_02501715, partial [Schizophyllum commune H4-8]|uniref:uncharacterized protein n=1 Tax=Schizophyllum commune (strain H4-8 / FGSC 9210) TaxID=578458 RepID=UPI0021603326